MTILLLIAGFVIGVVVTSFFWITCGPNEGDFERVAVAAGAGEYYLDSNYNRQFRFIRRTQ